MAGEEGLNAVEADADGFKATDEGVGLRAADGAVGLNPVDEALGLSTGEEDCGFRAADGGGGFSGPAGVLGFNAEAGCFDIGFVPGLTIGFAEGENVGGCTGRDGLLSSLFDNFLENLEKIDLVSFVSDGTAFNFTSWKDDSCCFAWVGGTFTATF